MYEEINDESRRFLNPFHKFALNVSILSIACVERNLFEMDLGICVLNVLNTDGQ